MKKNTKAKTIVLSSEKGGVGKTTIGYNLAVKIERKGKSVLLVDSDIQRSCHQTFEMRNKLTDAKILKCVSLLEEPLVKYHREKLEELKKELQLIKDRKFAVISKDESSELIKCIKENEYEYDYIIIDTKCSVTKGIIINLIEIANIVIFPYLDSALDLGTAININNLIKALKSSKPQLKTVFRSLLVCENTIRDKELKELEAYFQENFNHTHPLLKRKIKKRKIYKEAMLNGKGICEYRNQNAKIANSEFDELTNEILELIIKRGEI